MDQQWSQAEEETNHAVASWASLIAKCAFNNPSLFYFCNFSWYLSSFISRDKSCILCFSSHNFQSYLIAQKKNQGNLNIMDKQTITDTRSWGHLMIVKCPFWISPCVTSHSHDSLAMGNPRGVTRVLPWNSHMSRFKSESTKDNQSLHVCEGYSLTPVTAHLMRKHIQYSNTMSFSIVEDPYNEYDWRSLIVDKEFKKMPNRDSHQYKL